MRVLLTTTAAAGFLALTIGGASAFGPHFPPYTPPPADPECDCVPDALDVLQDISAAQTATNKIKDFKTVEDVTQEAVNVANSVNIDDDIDVPDMSSLTQTASGFQFASNYIQFGAGGYTGDGFAYDGDDLINQTQSALNAANLVNVPTLGAPVEQNSSAWQTALNTAEFEGVEYGLPLATTYGGHVTNMSQSATNVANSISAQAFYTFDDCECVEIKQYASGPQLAANAIIGSGSYNFGELTGAIQNATNIANSINGSLPE